MSGPFGKAGSGGGGGLEGTTRTAAEYEDEMVLTVLQNARLALLKEEDADEKEKQSQAQILSAYAAQGVSASADWKRRYYSVTLPNGNRVNAVAETRILSYEQPTLTGQMATDLEEKLGQAFSGLAGGARRAGSGMFQGRGSGSGGNVSTQDRIRNGWSEVIKETNTYYGNDGKVYEASTAYDHVYQGNQDQDSFIGTSGTAWEPGVDFDGLNRTNGNY